MKKLLLFLLLPLPFSQLNAQSPVSNFVLRSFIEKNKTNAEPAHFFVLAQQEKLSTYLQQHNGHIKYSFGKYNAITLPANQLENLAAQSFVQRIELSLQHPVALNDTMRVRNRVNQVHQGTAPLPQGYSGKGIIVGFVDTGMDFNHEDFKDSSGNTRVLRIWDQTQPNGALTPPAYGYGQVYDSAFINGGTCPHTDPSGHGTTVVGTAAGNGFSTGTHYGVAPDAWIIMVESNFNSPTWSEAVADGVDYIYKVADSMGMPCVINASIGDYYGSHDGLDLPAQFIDSLVKAKRGRLFVSAGGNSGELPNYHLGYTVTSDTNFTWMKYHPLNGSSAFPYGAVFFESWSDSADAANMRFSIGADKVNPYYKFRGETTWHGITDMLNTVLTDTIFSPNNDILGIVDYYSEFSFGRYLLQVHMEEPDSNAYYFRFSTTGTGRFDIWSDEWLGISNIVNNSLPTVAQYPDMVHYQTSDSSKIIVSGFNCMPSCITVANYNNLQQYTALSGFVNLGGIENSIAPSSSRGPTRDNRIKPEVSATGNVTFSPGPASLCSTYVASFPDRVLADSVHMRNGGTSMAAPVVTGIGALLLERCPTMNWEEFSDAVINSVYTDGFTGAVPNMSYGYGKVNAFGALQQTLFTPILSAPLPLAYCEGDSAQVIAMCTCNTYLWNTGDTTSSAYYNSPGAAWMLASNESGCKADTVHFNVIENPLPTPSFAVTTNTLTALPSGQPAYQWYQNGVMVGGNQDSYIITQSDTFYVAVTDGNGCTGVSPHIFVLYNSVEELQNQHWSLYPVPADDLLMYNLPKATETRVTVTDAAGKIIFEKTTTGIAGRIAVTNWPAGTYFFQWSQSNNSGKRQFIVR